MNAERLLAHYEKIADSPDAIPLLRRFVLNLAVRGRLVPQDPSDEPASELLKQIAAEKARLVRAGEIKKPQPQPLVLSREVKTRVPSNWALVPLGEVILRHLGGGTPSKSNTSYWNGELRWASVKDVGKSKYLDETIDRISEAGLMGSSSNLIEPGNLIVVTRMGLGKVSINRIPVAINQDLRALFLSQNVSIDYAYSFFLTHSFEGMGLTVKGIRLDDLLCIAFPLPPLAEQHRIVAKVDELIALCGRLEAARQTREATRDGLMAASLARLNAPVPDNFPDDARFALDALPAFTARADQIKQLRQTILNLAVRGKLVPQDANEESASELLKQIAEEKARLLKAGKSKRSHETGLSIGAQAFDLPVGWEWSQPNEFSLKITDGEHFRPPTLDKGVFFLSAKDIRDKGVSLSDPLSVSKETASKARARCDPDFGDILIVSRGATCGRICRVNIKETFCLLGSVILIKPSSLIDGGYLAWALRSPMIFAALVSASGATAQGAIYLRDLKKIAIPLPPLAEQHRIVAKVDDLMALCDRLEASLATADDTRRRLVESLLAEALEPGDIRQLEAAE